MCNIYIYLIICFNCVKFSLLVIGVICLNTILVGLHLLHVIAHLNTVHHVIAWLLLNIVLRAIMLDQWSQSLRLPLFQLHVDLLSFVKFHFELFDLVHLHAVLPLFLGGLGPCSLLFDFRGTLDQLNIALVVVELLLEIVNLLDEEHILPHESLVDFLVRLVGLGLSVTQMVNTLLQVLSLFLEIHCIIVILLFL